MGGLGAVRTWWRCWQNSQVGPTGGPVAALYLKLEKGETWSQAPPPKKNRGDPHKGLEEPQNRSGGRGRGGPYPLPWLVALPRRCRWCEPHPTQWNTSACLLWGNGVRAALGGHRDPPKHPRGTPPHLAEALTLAWPVKTLTKTRT